MAEIKPLRLRIVPSRWRSFSFGLKIILMVVVLLPHRGQGGLFAHPMPNSMVVLKVHEKHISGQIMLPLSELQSAIGMEVSDNSERLVERLGDSLRVYFRQHIRPRSFEGKPWTVNLLDMKVEEHQDSLVGLYKELVINFEMAPPQHYDLRNFYFDYDVVLHQVASHRAIVSVKQDWARGFVREDTLTQQVGVIQWDVVSGKLSPFQVSLAQGSWWTGFKNMLSLGISHIIEGTDHILFILTLLLAAIKPSQSNRKTSVWGWGLLGIITAFTVGHSLTLLLGSVQWLHFPAQPIEILIAVTILVSAFHAFRPIYPHREVLVAGAFGLIHGLAFSETLKELELSTRQMVLSILGFNVGIEVMQLVIIAVAFPALWLLSKTRHYPVFKQTAAALIIVAALGWLVERIQEKPNFITELLP
jgi:hydrogenase/urease accessory protein HupE